MPPRFHLKVLGSETNLEIDFYRISDVINDHALNINIYLKNETKIDRTITKNLVNF
jgi:hypothetical protein